MGCRVYPVIVDEEKGVVLDNLCPEIGSINDKEKSLKGKIVMKLLKEIDAEAANKRILSLKGAVFLCALSGLAASCLCVFFDFGAQCRKEAGSHLSHIMLFLKNR